MLSLREMLGRLGTAESAAETAGAALLEFRRTYGRVLTGTQKADGSLVTAADHMSSRTIKEVLRGEYPDDFILDEEDLDGHTIQRPKGFWIIDPLDGTWYFANGHDEYCVLIAYVYDGIPIIGVMHFPERDELLLGGHNLGTRRTVGADKSDLMITHPTDISSLTMLGSDNPKARELYKHLARHLGVKNQVAGKSSGDKYRRLFAGEIDLVATRFGSPAVWDTAPAHAMVLALGGDMRTLTGEVIDYTTAVKLETGTITIGNPALIPVLAARLPPAETLRI